MTLYMCQCCYIIQCIKISDFLYTLQEYEETIKSLRAQVGILTQRAGLLQEELDRSYSSSLSPGHGMHGHGYASGSNQAPALDHYARNNHSHDVDIGHSPHKRRTFKTSKR
jgi:hypothetical protein